MNILCLFLLLNVVITAFFAFPTPFQKLAFDQPNIAILYFPFNLLPTVIVPMVLFGHLLHFYSPFFTKIEETSRLSVFFDFFRADLAVDAFFVISGFLIGSILFKEYQKNLSLSFKSFYLKRFFRLMPVYFVSVFHQRIKDNS